MTVPASVRPFAVCLACLVAASLVASGCADGPSGTSAAPSAATAAPSQLELTVLMGHLQTYTDKVGLAVNAQNRGLALFYLDRIDRVLDEVVAVDTWEGVAVGALAPGMMRGGLSQLRGSVEKDDWTAARNVYEAVTVSCTGCHAATRHPQIVVVPVPTDAEPPWGQSFAAP